MSHLRIRRPSELSTAPPSTQQEVDRHVATHRREIERELMCGVGAIKIDREHAYVVVSIPKHHATDMSGCVRIVQRLAPWAERIDVYEGGNPDIRYEHDGEKWQAYRLQWRERT